MANDLEKKAQKQAEKEKKQNQLKSMKAAAAKKPKKSIVQYFKDVSLNLRKFLGLPESKFSTIPLLFL